MMNNIDESVENTVSLVFKKLICRVCETPSLELSELGAAKELKTIIVGLAEQGYNEEEVVSYVVRRYGDFVAVAPQNLEISVFLWFLPLLIIVVFAHVVLRFYCRDLEYGRQLELPFDD